MHVDRNIWHISLFVTLLINIYWWHEEPPWIMIGGTNSHWMNVSISKGQYPEALEINLENMIENTIF